MVKHVTSLTNGKKAKMKKANEILREAAEVIEERGKLRDTEGGERSMSRAVAAYNALCGDSMEGELQGWLFMCCLKLARATAGSTHLDDWTDLAGYAALAAEYLGKEQSITPSSGCVYRDTRSCGCAEWCEAEACHIENLDNENYPYVKR